MWPGIESSLKDADHPFYSKVYEEAAKINHEFAGQMDACIIRKYLFWYKRIV